MNKNETSFTRFFFLFAILMVASFHIGCSESDDTDNAETLNLPDNSQEMQVSNRPTEQVEEPLDGGAENADINGGQDGVDDPIENRVEVRDNAIRADVTKVTVSGNPGVYTLRVTVKSPDTGASSTPIGGKYFRKMENSFTDVSCCIVTSESSHSPVLVIRYLFSGTRL